MRKPITIEFSEFAPDQGDFSQPPALSAMDQAEPAALGFQKCRRFVANGTVSMTSTYGAASFVKADGSPITIAGTRVGLMAEDSATSVWTDVSRGSAYALTGADYWEFVNFGGSVYAAGSSATADPIQSFDLESSTSFADVPGAPAAKHISVIRDFVVVGGTNEATDGNKPSRVRWSAFQDGTSWTVSAVTQADYQDLDTLNPNIGAVRRILGGEYGLVFCDRGVYRMQYVGSPVVFQFDDISPGLGTRYGNSVAQVGDVAYFWTEKGFHKITAGGEITPIGTQRVDNWVSENYLVTAFDDFHGIPDPNSTRVMFAFATSTNGAALFYDYALNKWGSYAQSGVILNARSFFVYQSESAGYRAIAYLQPSATDGLQWLFLEPDAETNTAAMQVTTAPMRLSEDKITIHRVRVLGRRGQSDTTVSIKAGAEFAFGEDGYTGGLNFEEREQADLVVTSKTDSYPCRLTGRDFQFTVSGYYTVRGIQILEWSMSGQR